MDFMERCGPTRDPFNNLFYNLFKNFENITAREKNSFSLDTWSYADVRLSRQSWGRALYDGADDFFDRPHLTTPVERFVNWNSAYGIFAMISFAFEKKVEPIISPKTSQRAGGAPKLNRYQATFFT